MSESTLITTSILQAEVNAILCKAVDTFRCTVDPSEYKNYILVMLFVKYVSDVWHDHRAQYEREFVGDGRPFKPRYNPRFAASTPVDVPVPGVTSLVSPPSSLAAAG